MNARIVPVTRGRRHSAVKIATQRHAWQTDKDPLLYGRWDRHQSTTLIYSEISIPSDAAVWAKTLFGWEAFANVLDERHASHRSVDHHSSQNAVERSAWATLSQRLWASVEDGEDRLNKLAYKARLARSVRIGLRDMWPDRPVERLQTYVRDLLTSRGMVVDWVVRKTDNGDRFAHFMLTLRRIDTDDWCRLKARDWDRYDLFKRISEQARQFRRQEVLDE